MENIIDYAKGKVKKENLKSILNQNKNWMKESWDYPEFLCLAQGSTPYFQEQNNNESLIEEISSLTEKYNLETLK